MNYNKRKTISDDLNKYCYFSNKDDHDFIEITEWTNGEGYTVCIEAKNDKKLFDITRGQWEAMCHLINSLEYSFKDNFKEND